MKYFYNYVSFISLILATSQFEYADSTSDVGHSDVGRKRLYSGGSSAPDAQSPKRLRENPSGFAHSNDTGPQFTGIAEAPGSSTVALCPGYSSDSTISVDEAQAHFAAGPSSREGLRIHIPLGMSAMQTAESDDILPRYLNQQTLFRGSRPSPTFSASYDFPDVAALLESMDQGGDDILLSALRQHASQMMNTGQHGPRSG